MRTEDCIRNTAREILGFNETEINTKQDCGQITTFNQLCFVGVVDKPDGWYLPDDVSKPTIILGMTVE